MTTCITFSQLVTVAERLRQRGKPDVPFARLSREDHAFWLTEAENILKPAGIEVTR